MGSNKSMSDVRRKARKRQKKNKKLKTLERSNGVCHYCKTPLTVDTMTIEHLVPRCRGGSNEPENVVAACMQCNCTHKNPLDFNPPKGTPGWYPKYIPHA